MKKIISLALVALAVGTALPASAQFAKAEDAIKYRQSALFVMGQHFGRLGAMANGKIPYDAKAAAEDAEIVDGIAKLPWAAFGPGTKGGKSKPAIWTEEAKFKEHSDKLIAATDKLEDVAKNGNLETLKVAFGATAGTCKSCHDAFRSK